MGRRRVPRNIKRSPVSISLPEKLIMRMDEVLGEKLTRSRYIERLIEHSLKGKQSTLNLIYHHWACQCGHEWTTNNPQTSWAVCRACKGTNPEYMGIHEQGDDE